MSSSSNTPNTSYITNEALQSIAARLRAELSTNHVFFIIADTSPDHYSSVFTQKGPNSLVCQLTYTVLTEFFHLPSPEAFSLIQALSAHALKAEKNLDTHNEAVHPVNIH